MNKSLWLIGVGHMAVEYVKVLDALSVPFTAIGRGEESAAAFEKKCGRTVRTGGLNKWLNNSEVQNPESAIVAVGMEQLAPVTINLLKNGVKKILVEKPGGLNIEEINKVAEESKKRDADVFVAYNRRFYASVQKAQEIIQDDGGVTSFHFEFTEWSHKISELKKAPGVKENWFIGNSSHVVDLAFFLGSHPKEIISFTAGGLKWHPVASIFSGAGIAENGALFSYQANWEAPGRWGIEIMTQKYRLIFRPLEKLQIQEIGSINTDFVEIDDNLDKNFKPGLYNETKNFLNKSKDQLCTIHNQEANIKYYKKMLGQ